MKHTIKAIRFGWPLLLVLFSCSSHKKQFYYFDHQQYISTETKREFEKVKEPEQQKEIKADTPLVYASLEHAVAAPSAQVFSQSRKTLKKPSVLVKDSIPDKKIERKKRLKKFGIAAIALSPTAAIVSFFSWPVGIIIAAVAIVFSVAAFWSNKKLLAIIGLFLALLAMLVALIVMDSPILQHGNDSGFGMGPII